MSRQNLDALLVFMADLNYARMTRRYYGGIRYMKPLKSIQEAAAVLGISPWTVRAYIRDRRLRPVRLGRRVLLAEEELERLIAKEQERSNPQPDANPNGDEPQEAMQ